jgi:hypothetical protein
MINSINEDMNQLRAQNSKLLEREQSLKKSLKDLAKEEKVWK